MSRLLTNSESFRKANEARNTYNSKADYNTGHENALSDGDELGKGEVDGSVGSATDIRQKNALEAKNLYTPKNEYGISNA
jgi:hypothetical protein